MRKLSSILLALVLVLSACEGAEGPAGLTGPQGPSGPQGPAGPQGPPGEGLEATAYTFTIDPDDFYNDLMDEGADYPAPAITQEVLEGGVILSYLSLGGPMWIAMPFALPITGTSVTLTFGAVPGTYILELLKAETTAKLINAFEGSTVRVVVIEPGSILTGKRAIDYGNYEEVARVYGL